VTLLGRLAQVRTGGSRGRGPVRPRPVVRSSAGRRR
jgi:hypothetical protein